MSELVSVTRDGDIGIITINNPPVNALSPGVPEGIIASLDTLRADPAVKAVVLIGGCDQTVPAQLMGAASADKPAVQVVTGPMSTGRHRGRVLTLCGPAILVAEQAVGGALHHHHVFRMRADAAEDAEHRLHEQRRLHEAAFEEVVQVVQVGDVVALELEARAVARAGPEDVFDVVEGVAEDEVARRFQELRLPLVLEVLVARIDVDCDERKANRRTLPQIVECLHERPAVLPA